jgi:hypothetical protein
MIDADRYIEKKDNRHKGLNLEMTSVMNADILSLEILIQYSLTKMATLLRQDICLKTIYGDY